MHVIPFSKSLSLGARHNIQKMIRFVKSFPVSSISQLRRSISNLSLTKGGTSGYLRITAMALLEELIDAIKRVRGRIERHDDELSRNEMLTRYALVDSILRALGETWPETASVLDLP